MNLVVNDEWLRRKLAEVRDEAADCGVGHPLGPRGSLRDRLAGNHRTIDLGHPWSSNSPGNRHYQEKRMVKTLAKAAKKTASKK